jgi:integrase-like protein
MQNCHYKMQNLIIRDRDRAFAYTPRIGAMGIRDHAVAARSPWLNRSVERLIGSILRECLDHVVVLGEPHLRRILKTYAAYYNEVWTHMSLGKDAPNFRRSGYRQHCRDTNPEWPASSLCPGLGFNQAQLS